MVNEQIGKFKVRETGLIYVSPCSDVDPSLELNRRFVEFQVLGVIPPWDENTDNRYLIYCADVLRSHKVLNGATEREALVSVNSPMLFTWKEFGEMRRNQNSLKAKQDLISVLLDETSKKPVAPHLRNWRRDHLNNAKELGLDNALLVDMIHSDLESLDTKVVIFDKENELDRYLGI